MLLTNASAQVALRTLRVANAGLQQTQDRISSGLKVAKADDNPAFFLVATTQRSDVAVLDGTRDNLLYALGAVQTAMAAQTEIDTAILNIKRSLVALENGVAIDELNTTIEDQVALIKNVLSGTSFNGVNLLERRNVEDFVIGVEREGTNFDFQTLNIVGAGLGIRTAPVNTLAPPYPGAVLDLNSTVLTGSPGNLNPTLPPNTVGVNIGTNPAGISQRTFAISFETGSDITTQQVIYEEGGNVRGLNISIRNGQLVFGGYNLVTTDPTPAWPYAEVAASIEANTRYTAQLVLDGNALNTGEFRAYVNGVEIAAAPGVGILYDHPGGIGIGRINGNGVVGGTVVNRITGPGGNDFQGLIDKVVIYNEVYTGAEFDQINTYLAEGWLPPRTIQYYIGSPSRRESATLVELLDAVIPVTQDGFTVSGALEILDAAQDKVNRAFTELGFYEARLSRQRDYLFGITDSMEEGIASLVEADLAEESARLQARQVQTQLATQSLFIANQRPQSLLRLFN